MKNMRDIVCFDVETTGLSQKEDFIIQLSMTKIDRNLNKKESKSWYIKPIHTYEIKPTAIEKHGITKEFLEENGVCIKDIANEIIEFTNNCDILTYNGNSFDIGFLYKDLKIVGVEFDLSNRNFYDAFLLYKQLHPSTLEAVYKFYTGKELEDAHNANSDVDATIEVLRGICNEVSDDIQTSLDSFNDHNIVSPENSIKRVVIDNIESLVFAMGKYKDEEFMSVYKKDPQYIKWFIINVASEYTYNILKKYCEKSKKSK